MSYLIEYIECRDTDRQIVGIINNATSIIWQSEYIGTGNFQITVPYSEEYFEWLQPGKYISRKDRDELGFIEAVTISYSVTDGRMLTVEGRFGLVLLERRLWADLITATYRAVTLSYPDNSLLEEICKQCVDETLVNADWGNRNVSWLSVEASQGFTVSISGYSWVTDNALDLLIQEMKRAYDSNTGMNAPLGHKMFFDRATRNMTYCVFQGRLTDLIFSQQYNNLLTFEYSYDEKQFKTAFLIGGEGDGKDKFFTQRDRTYATGENRKEYLFDSQQSKSGIEINGQTVRLTDAQYNQLLLTDCASHFSEYYATKSIKGTVDVSSLTFGADFKLGDIVTIRDEGTLIDTLARIWSVTEVQDENGYTITANFEGEAS